MKRILAARTQRTRQADNLVTHAPEDERQRVEGHIEGAGDGDPRAHVLTVLGEERWYSPEPHSQAAQYDRSRVDLLRLRYLAARPRL